MGPDADRLVAVSDDVAFRSRQLARSYYLLVRTRRCFLSRRPSPPARELRLSSANHCNRFNRSARFLSLLGTVATLAARSALAQSSASIDSLTVGNTRYEMERVLLEIDERRRRLEMELDPVDSVLRMLALDTVRIAGFRRARQVDVDVDRVWNAAAQLGQTDGADLSRTFADVVMTAARDFSSAEATLKTRVVVAGASNASPDRVPTVAVVTVNGPLPPYDTPLWDKVRMSDFGRTRVPRVTTADVSRFQAAVSDSGFQVYKQTLIGAFGRRMQEIRVSRDSGRAEVQRLRQRAMALAHRIGEQEANGTQFDARLVYFGLPAFAAVLIILFLMPLMYRRPDVQQWLLTSGMLLELATIVIVTATVILLALAGRIHAEVIGALLGALSGYMLGRAGSRRAANAPLVTNHARLPAPQPAEPTLPSPAPAPAMLRRRDGQPALPTPPQS